ncbi:DUF1775 domain-containing protein [Geodermatophilus sp. SYSU D00705]
MTSRSAALRRSLATGVLAAVLVGAVPGAAAAHVEVSAPGATAGTGPVTLTFSAESEAPTGIVAMRTQLPAGLAPADVALASGPAGWTLAPTADGFEVGGPALPAGGDAEYAVTVAQLPAGTTELVFKTLQRYADGREDAWIELPAAGAPEPERPAPVLTVAPGAPAPAATAASGPPSGAPQSGPATDAAPATTPAAVPADEEGGVSGGWLAALGVLAAAAVAAGLWFRRARAGRPGGPA